MAFPEKHYRWTWEFRATPDALWPLVSNTDRFNRDCGLPPFEFRAPLKDEPPAEPGVRRLRSVYLGLTGEWEEREFEWVQPVRLGQERVFTKGPLVRMVSTCELAPGKSGGTTMTYEMRVTPKNLVGAALIPLSIGFGMRRTAERVFRAYDAAALRGEAEPADFARMPGAGSATQGRLAAISSKLVAEARLPAPLVERLGAYVAGADELSVTRMRPYVLADAWGSDRKETLDLFLHATRGGMLDFSWEVLCPHCRGSRQGKADLTEIRSEDRCESCGIDFSVNFDQSVELTFIPNPSVRRVSRLEYCVGGPRVTPHIVAQKRLMPMENLYAEARFPEGRYRVRSQGLPVQHAFRVEAGGAEAIRIEVGPGPAPTDEPALAPGGVLNVLNVDMETRLVVAERMAWSDQAVTAAAVTSRQIFRDLFAREVLRQGERISVGSITIVFTDLKNSTRMYNDIGDAPAFGRVLTHFDTLKAAVAAEDGAIVKTMGDAVMAVFPDPACAFRAMRRAQAELKVPADGRAPLALKCSIHQGPSLAINQNDRLDYFGTTVNIASRLCSLSTGRDLVVSERVMRDPEVSRLVADPRELLAAKADSAPLRGFGEAAYDFWRVTDGTF